jgi:peptide/nickel transport system substrate-binding protein
MRRSIIRLGIVSVTCLSLFGVARPAVAAPEGTVTWGVHITLASRWLDPAETEGIITPFMFLYALHDAVVKPMPGGWNTPSLAESWSQSKDGLTYEFVLRKGVKFHNGDPVTAEDVKFSYERYRGAGVKLLKDRVREVQIVDPGRIRFVLKEPWPDFMTFYGTSATGSGWVVPKKYVEKVGDDGFKKAPIGAGPYKFVSFNPGVELVLEAYEGYWRKTPSVKRLVLRSLPEETTRAAALKKGEIDVAYLLTGPVAEDIRRTPGLKLTAPSTASGVFWLDMPDQWDPKSPWADRRVRLAASHAIDRAALNQAETLGLSKPTGGIIPRAFEFSKSFDPPAFDPARAKQLMTEAGYPNGFDAGDFYPWPPYTAMGEALASYLQAIGIKSRIRIMERATLTTAWREKKLKNLIVGITGAAGNAATRLEAYVSKEGAYTAGVIRCEAARSADPPDPADPARSGDARPHLRAGVHLGHRAAARGAGHQLDPRLRLLGALRGPEAQAALEAEKLLERGEDGLGIVLVQRVNSPRNLDEPAPRELLGHPLGDVTVQHGAALAAEHERRRRDRAQDRPPVEVELGPSLLDARVPRPHKRSVGALAQARRHDPAVVVDSRIRVSSVEVLRRLLDAVPGRGLRRTGRGGGGALADLGTDVDDDQLLDELGPFGREVDRVAAAHRESDQHERGDPELSEDAIEVVECRDRVVDVRGIAVAVSALIERVDVEVGLERDAQGIPRVRVAREAVQEQQRRAAFAAPVEQMQPQTVDREGAIDRAQEIHRG